MYNVQIIIVQVFFKIYENSFFLNTVLGLNIIHVFRSWFAHWGLPASYAIMDLVKKDSGNGLSPVQHQANQAITYC